MSTAVQHSNAKTKGQNRHIGILSQVGLVTAIAALVGASCCALPLALAWVGLAGAWIANLEFFGVYRPYITVFAMIVVGLGWVIAVRRRASLRTLLVRGVATIFIAAALLVAHYETDLTRYLIVLRRKS
jgi:mercuric ion transport protein